MVRVSRPSKVVLLFCPFSFLFERLKKPYSLTQQLTRLKSKMLFFLQSNLTHSRHASVSCIPSWLPSKLYITRSPQTASRELSIKIMSFRLHATISREDYPANSDGFPMCVCCKRGGESGNFSRRWLRGRVFRDPLV